MSNLSLTSKMLVMLMSLVCNWITLGMWGRNPDSMELKYLSLAILIWLTFIGFIFLVGTQAEIDNNQTYSLKDGAGKGS